MKLLIRFLVFLVLNFTALGLGIIFTNKGVSSPWYSNINKAPWTPDGWVFGFAWTSIMICFALYMAFLFLKVEKKKELLILFGIQWILNITWNPFFFYLQQPITGLIIISLLTVLIGYFLFNYWSKLKFKSVFIFPYLLWLCIATSLNLYIVIYN
jgi:benzodiazapine receptor